MDILAAAAGGGGGGVGEQKSLELFQNNPSRLRRQQKTLTCFLLYGATEGGLQVEKRGSEYSAFTVNRGLPQNYYTKEVGERKKERTYKVKRYKERKQEETEHKISNK